MFELFLPLALLATFGAVVAAGFGIQAALANRRRAVEHLEAQVKEVSIDLRRHALTQPFSERVAIPFLQTLGGIAKRITPIGMRERIARQLVLAGSPPGMDADKMAALKVFGGTGGAVLGFTLSQLFGFEGLMVWAATAFVTFFVYLLPGAGLGQRALGRQETLRNELPDVMDLLSISVEAGLSFDAAVAHVRKSVEGPLSDELGRMLQEMQFGASRVEALRHLGERTSVDELKGFVLAMVQADAFGVSITSVLRSQAQDLRVRRRQRAEEKAQKVPLKLLFPLIFCILPGMFVVLLGPGVLRIGRALFGLNI